MTVQNPEAFFLLMLPVAAAFFHYVTFREGRKDLSRLAGLWREHRLKSIFLLKTFFSAAAFLLSMVFLIFALAGFSWGVSPAEEISSGLDVALTVDVSRSMLAQDLRPNRLQKAVESARFFVEGLPGARFSLTVFRGGAQTLVPLTQDSPILDHFFEELDPDLLTAAGTQMEDGLKLALKTLSLPSARKKVVILISDGENKVGNPLAVAKEAGAKGIPIFTLTLGTEAGAAIPLRDGSFVLDGFGGKVTSQANRRLLEAIAKESEGQSFVYSDRQALLEMQLQLGAFSNSAVQSGVRLEQVSRFRVFLVLSIGFLLIFLALRIVKWKNLF